VAKITLLIGAPDDRRSPFPCRLHGNPFAARVEELIHQAKLDRKDASSSPPKERASPERAAYSQIVDAQHTGES